MKKLHWSTAAGRPVANKEQLRDMIQNKSWYLDHQKIEGKKYIGLGRREWYDNFADRLSEFLKTRIYLCDYMDWIDTYDYRKSLLFYIESAERIDVNLKGIRSNDLFLASHMIGKRIRDRSELGIVPMTVWEINQICFGGMVGKTYWHLEDEDTIENTWGIVTIETAYLCLGQQVPVDRIYKNFANKGKKEKGFQYKLHLLEEWEEKNQRCATPKELIDIFDLDVSNEFVRMIQNYGAHRRSIIKNNKETIDEIFDEMKQPRTQRNEA